MAALPSPHKARGGRYVPNHESFGAMMVSEQVRTPLVAVSKMIAGTARLNTKRSNAADNKNRQKSLADQYELDRGPIVTLIVVGKPSPRISHRVVNRARHAAAREFGIGGWRNGKGTRDLRRAGEKYGDLAGEAG